MLTSLSTMTCAMTPSGKSRPPALQPKTEASPHPPPLPGLDSAVVAAALSAGVLEDQLQRMSKLQRARGLVPARATLEDLLDKAEGGDGSQGSEVAPKGGLAYQGSSAGDFTIQRGARRRRCSAEQRRPGARGGQMHSPRMDRAQIAVAELPGTNKECWASRRHRRCDQQRRGGTCEEHSTPRSGRSRSSFHRWKLDHSRKNRTRVTREVPSLQLFRSPAGSRFLRGQADENHRHSLDEHPHVQGFEIWSAVDMTFVWGYLIT